MTFVRSAPTSAAAPASHGFFRRTAVAVGGLFVLQLLTFAVGSSLIESYLAGDAARSTLVAGVFLEMFSGVAIVAIGILMYRVLKAANAKWAMGYPVMRLTEFAVSALLAVYLLTQLAEFPNHLLWIYLPTAIGGLILNYIFLTSGLIPRPLAVLGLIGYGLLLLTVPLDLLGAIDVESGTGLALLAPGGLYEFLILPIWLFTKGFRTPHTA